MPPAEEAQWVKTLGVMPGTCVMKKRTDPYKSSPDLHTPAYKHTHTQNKLTNIIIMFKRTIVWPQENIFSY